MTTEKKLSEILPDENDRNSKIIRQTVRIGCIINIFLMIMKLTAGYLGNSDALVADGYHSLNDVAADLIMLLFVGISYRKPDDNYPWGYGKFETFSSFLISVFLVIIALHIAVEACESIVNFMNGEELPRPDLWTFIVVLLAMFCKELLFRFYSRRGRKAECKALIANAWHHRSDALASIATLIGVTFSHFFGASFRILDPIASLVIAGFILFPALRLFLPAFRELTDSSLSGSERDKALIAIKNVGGVIEVKYIRTRRIGHHLVFDIAVRIPEGMTIKEGSAITEAIRESLYKAFCHHIFVSVTFV